MSTRRKQWMTGGLLLAAVLWAGAAGAQNFGTGSQNGSSGTTGSSSQSSAASVNNAPTFDPAAQAAARLLGTYRVPGSVQIDPTGGYRVPLPDTGGSASAATTSAATPSTTTTSASTATTSTTTSTSP